MRRAPAPWSLARVVLAASLVACADGPRPPSVLLVSIDTLRADHVGLYGYERDTTPFLDRFAADATVFEHAFTTAPWTLPAHMTMLTGLFPAQHGVVREDVALAAGIPRLAERLRAAGSQTVALYYPCWIGDRHGFERGFDVFREHDSVEEARAHAAEELARLDRTRPWFLFFHVMDVHDGPLASGEHMLYASPPPYQDWFMPDAAAKLPDVPPDELWESENLLDADERAALVALYDGGIRHVDANHELLFEALAGDGWLDDTLVVVTSDHGESLAQRGRLDGHGELAQEGLHVPLVVRHPRGQGAGTRVGAPVHLGDVVPTVLALAGLDPDPRLPGRDLFGALPPERVITGTYLPNEFAVRWPEKLVHREGTGTVAFDLERDPGELAPRPAQAARFRALAREALGETRFPAPLELAPMSAEERAAQRARGYGGDDE
jgi:arylsulfatase A-like enzyme